CGSAPRSMARTTSRWVEPRRRLPLLQRAGAIDLAEETLRVEPGRIRRQRAGDVRIARRVESDAVQDLDSGPVHVGHPEPPAGRVVPRDVTRPCTAASEPVRSP